MPFVLLFSIVSFKLSLMFGYVDVALLSALAFMISGVKIHNNRIWMRNRLK
jgi:hypothetical protein